MEQQSDEEESNNDNGNDFIISSQPATDPDPTSGLTEAKVLNNFFAENEDELTITENEIIFICDEECDFEGWAVVRNSLGQKGNVPFSYLYSEEEEFVDVGNEMNNDSGASEIDQDDESTPKFLFSQPTDVSSQSTNESTSQQTTSQSQSQNSQSTPEP